MKKWVIACLMVCAGVCITSCELDTYDNGNLDGYWHLEQIDTLATGGIKDVSNERLFWAIQAKLLMLYNQDLGYNQLVLKFSYNGDRLVLSEPHLYNRETGDEPQTDTSLLAPYGIHALTLDWKVEKLTGSEMILSSNLLRIRLKKF